MAALMGQMKISRLVAAKTKILVTDSLLVDGQQKTMRKVILLMEEHFIQPLQQLQRLASPQYSLGPPLQQKKLLNCSILYYDSMLC